MNEPLIFESIYRFTDDRWEWVPLRMPPYAMFADHDISIDDIAELLVELQREYDFPVTDCPECVQDVVDLVMCRPFSRVALRTNAEVDSAYDFTAFAVPPSNPSLWQRLSLIFRDLFKY